METLVKADIFFFVATIALALITVGFIVAMIYVVRILNDVKYVSKRAKEETDKIVKDVGMLRRFLKFGLKNKIKKVFKGSKKSKK